MSNINILNDYIRGVRMFRVRDEAQRLLEGEYAGKLETSKPEIVSDLKEYGRHVVGIVVDKVQVWDNGSIDLEFGKLVPPGN